MEYTELWIIHAKSLSQDNATDMQRLKAISEMIQMLFCLKTTLSNGRMIGIKYQVQFVDYKENEWTVPVNATMERILRYTNDESVSKIKLICGEDEIICSP